MASNVCRLREVARWCNFGQALSEMLRNRLVSGVSDERIQKLLLLEAKLTLDGVLKIAQAQEAAGKCLREILAKSQGYCAYGEEKCSGFDGAMFSLWES